MTGLRDEAVRSKLQPFLQETDVADVELIEQINFAVSEESERQGEFGATHQRSVRMNSSEDGGEPGSELHSKKAGAPKESKSGLTG